MRTAAQKEARDIDNAVDILYPAKPDPPLPSPLDASQLVGTYFNEGYGVLHIDKAEPGSRAPLVARRDDMLFMYALRFKHVSGAFWVIEVWYDDTNSMADFWGGEFVAGVDGGVEGLTVKIGTGERDAKGGSVWFEKKR